MQLVIPPGLAYGNRQVGDIPAGATLVFNVEVVAVNPPAPNTKGTMQVVA
jgi:FKBP-type peptidyl-prolyl cis-trans isomerase